MNINYFNEDDLSQARDTRLDKLVENNWLRQVSWAIVSCHTKLVLSCEVGLS